MKEWLHGIFLHPSTYAIPNPPKCYRSNLIQAQRHRDQDSGNRVTIPSGRMPPCSSQATYLRCILSSKARRVTAGSCYRDAIGLLVTTLPRKLPRRLTGKPCLSAQIGPHRTVQMTTTMRTSPAFTLALDFVGVELRPTKISDRVLLLTT